MSQQLRTMTVATELDLAIQQIDDLLSKLQVRTSQVAQQPALGSANGSTSTSEELVDSLKAASSLKIRHYD